MGSAGAGGGLAPPEGGGGGGGGGAPPPEGGSGGGAGGAGAPEGADCTGTWADIGAPWLLMLFGTSLCHVPTPLTDTAMYTHQFQGRVILVSYSDMTM